MSERGWCSKGFVCFTHLIQQPIRTVCCYPHFTDGDTEAQRGQERRPRSHRRWQSWHAGHCLAGVNAFSSEVLKGFLHSPSVSGSEHHVYVSKLEEPVSAGRVINEGNPRGPLWQAAFSEEPALPLSPFLNAIGPGSCPSPFPADC